MCFFITRAEILQRSLLMKRLFLLAIWSVEDGTR